MPDISKADYEKRVKQASGGKLNPTLKLKEPVVKGNKVSVTEYIVEAVGDWHDVTTPNGIKPVIDVKVIGSDDPDVTEGKNYTLWGSATVLYRKLTEFSFAKGSKAKIQHLGKPAGKTYNNYLVESV